ncbi:M48 family metalloprotease [Actomonas aquatica]|uniref:M48 family metallopeptidase n=1 Tax=Actomonas aquatica TaxID=2866162 RepID=A0ABZ1C6I0_9BACT|nr:tetratricopeptide repeat protein [Opitutus sp. WL0086]WRQ87061.1 M48 family metallopeptidase [Opitutus sp. WL0086]
MKSPRSVILPVTLSLLGLAVTGCATGPVPSLGETTPSVALEDEPLLLDNARIQVARLEASGLLIDLPATEAYLQDIALRLAADRPALAAVLKIHVVQDPTLNAFALPSGDIYLHTGLLARLDNEAQVATILAHEMAHIHERHGLRRYRQTKASLTVFNVLAVSGGSYGSILGGVGALAAVSGYSRDLEREADDAGFRSLHRAGYDLHATTQVFDVLQFESQRSQRKEPFFFGSHPRLVERRNSFADLLIKHGVPTEPGTLGELTYRQHLPALIQADLDGAFRTGDFEGADQLLTRLDDLAANDPTTAFLHGEWHRRNPTDGDPTTAIEHYRRALVLDDSHPEAWRGLGLVLGQIERPAEARAALQRYLELAPVANDRAHILSLLQTWSDES